MLVCVNNTYEVGDKTWSSSGDGGCGSSLLLWTLLGCILYFNINTIISTMEDEDCAIQNTTENSNQTKFSPGSSAAFSKNNSTTLSNVNTTELETSLTTVDPTESQCRKSDNKINISHYGLIISYDMTNLYGELFIEMRFQTPMNEFCLHFNGNKVSVPKFFQTKNQSKDSTPIDVKNMEHDKIRKRLIFQLSNEAKDGNDLLLKMNFISPLNKFEEGATLMKYDDRAISLMNVNKSMRWLIGTYFYPNYGKNVFPCLENPDQRSVFHLKINRKDKVKTVSNTALSKTEPKKNETFQDVFLDTPPISLSSFMFFILPQHHRKTIKTSKPHLIIWYPPYLKRSIDSIVPVAVKLLDFLNKFFRNEIAAKQISIVMCEGLYSDPPASFNAIVMSTKLLFEKQVQTYENNENLYYFLAQQFSDLWIGNVVNFRSMSDLWILEGFSLYVAHVAVTKVYPDYDFSSFLSRIQEMALNYRQNDKTRMFNPSKGACLFHMVYNILGHNVFQEAVQKFITKWALKNVDKDQLWNTFDEVQSKISIKQFIGTWDKHNYPILNVGFENDIVVIERKSLHHEDSRWIPINYFKSSDEKVDSGITDWIKGNEKLKKNDIKKSWLIVNPQYTALIRTNYSKNLWELLGNEFKNKQTKIPSSVRAQTLDDAFSLASEGVLDYSVPLSMAMYLKNEGEYTPWAVALKHFSYIAEFLIDCPEWESFQKYMVNIMSTLYESLGKDRKLEKLITEDLRKLLISWSCINQLPNGCVTWAKDLFEKWRNDTLHLIEIKLPMELRSVVYCSGATISPSSAKLLYYFSKVSEIQPDEEMRLLRAVSCTNDIDTLKNILEDLLDINKPSFSVLRLKEFWHFLSQSSKNSLQSFNFIKSNWDTICKRFNGSNYILNIILRGVTNFMKTRDHYKEVVNLKGNLNKDNTELHTIFDHVLLQISGNINWVDNYLNNIRNWLKLNKSK